MGTEIGIHPQSFEPQMTTRDQYDRQVLKAWKDPEIVDQRLKAVQRTRG
jgi:hypothetical protein